MNECTPGRRADGAPLPSTCCGGWVDQHDGGAILCDPCPPVALTRADKERMVNGMSNRLTTVSMDFAYAISQGAAPDIKRLRSRKRWLHAALVRLAMARTVD